MCDSWVAVMVVGGVGTSAKNVAGRPGMVGTEVVIVELDKEENEWTTDVRLAVDGHGWSKVPGDGGEIE